MVLCLSKVWVKIVITGTLLYKGFGNEGIGHEAWLSLCPPEAKPPLENSLIPNVKIKSEIPAVTPL